MTIISPTITVEEPETHLSEKKTGLKLVQMYVGADKVGEWPVIEENIKKLELKGSEYYRRVTAPQGPVIIVAEDYARNVKIKKMDGAYTPPFCYDDHLATENHCRCEGSLFISNTPPVPVETKDQVIEHKDMNPQKESTKSKPEK
jgi:hypothetical protein